MASLSSPLSLPCGLELKNRLAKAAMAEDLAEKGANPSANINRLYEQWSDGGWGTLLTGNVMIDSKQLGSVHDVAVPAVFMDPAATESEKNSHLSRWKVWADTIQSHGTPSIMQINHPGRQAARTMRTGQSIAPSAIPLNLGPGIIHKFMSWFAFGTPRAMIQADIDDVVKRFATTAKVSSDAGFSGIELHAAHGYLLAQFLSPNSNQRTDGYGGSALNRARIVREIIKAIREAVPKEFAVGIKFNSADHQVQDGLQDALDQIGSILEVGVVDFLEISGGTYENPTMAGPEFSDHGKPRSVGDAPVSSRTAAREAFFIDFAREVRARYPDLKLMLTGGFKTRAGMQDALDSGACDLIGLARPSVVTPRLPRELIFREKEFRDDEKLPMQEAFAPWLISLFGYLGIKPLGGGIVTLQYQRGIRKLLKYKKD